MTKKRQGEPKPKNDTKRKQQEKKLPEWVNESNYEEYLDMVMRSKEATAREKERAMQYKRQLDIYKKEQEEYEKNKQIEQHFKKTRLAQLAEKDRFGRNYQARDYFTHVSSWTASQVIRKPFNRSGLRNEFVSRGYTGRSGLPEMDNNWDDTVGSTVKGRVKGNLSIGEGSRKRTNKLTPSIVPNLGYLLNNPVGSGIGSGNVIMPIVMKFKKRGGKFKRDEWWL